MRVESAASVFVRVTFKASVQVLEGARLVPAIHLVPQDQLNFYPYIRFGSDWVSDNDLHCIIARMNFSLPPGAVLR
jgi:hypothetical protein